MKPPNVLIKLHDGVPLMQFKNQTVVTAHIKSVLLNTVDLDV